MKAMRVLEILINNPYKQQTDRHLVFARLGSCISASRANGQTNERTDKAFYSHDSRHHGNINVSKYMTARKPMSSD